MVNYIKTRRLAIPLLIFVGLFSAVMTFAFWHLGHKYVTKAIPHHTVTISFDDKREFISLSPEEIRQYFNYVTDCYMNAGMNFMLTVFMLIFFIGGMTIARITNRKAHRTLLSRPTKAEVVV
jgi:cbb3-type cytochrome oxidase subunit 3